MRLSHLSLAVVILAPLSLAGCADSGGLSGVKLKGKLVSDGQPYAVQAGENVSLQFVGKDSKGRPIAVPANVTENGEFTVEGNENRGLPAGEYTVTLEQQPYPPGSGPADRFGGRYAPGKSKLNVTIPASSPPPIVIDVNKGTVSNS
jgi:hypothetical protein